MISHTIHNVLDTLQAKARAETLTRKELDHAVAVLRDAACDVRELEMRAVPPVPRVEPGGNVVIFRGKNDGDAA